MDSTTRFSYRVEHYVRFRPRYPKEIIAFLEREIGLTASMTVADIGSGTGISTELFLRYGNTVYAVEPNKEMREKGEELLTLYPRFMSIDGTAEQTRLQNESIDVIIAGQAFHWFDPVKTKIEFKRIATTNAFTVLLWNERQIKSDIEKAYENFVLNYATDYISVNHKNITGREIELFFSPNQFKLQTFYNEQNFDFAGLKGRVLSSSYMPNEHHPNYEAMIVELRQLYEQHKTDDKVKFEYETKLYVGNTR